MTLPFVFFFSFLAIFYGEGFNNYGLCKSFFFLDHKLHLNTFYTPKQKFQRIHQIESLCKCLHEIELEQEASTHATNIPKDVFQFIVLRIQKFATQNLNQTLTCSIRYVDLHGKVNYGDILDSIEGLMDVLST